MSGDAAKGVLPSDRPPALVEYFERCVVSRALADLSDRQAEDRRRNLCRMPAGADRAVAQVGQGGLDRVLTCVVAVLVARTARRRRD
ncbi:hypothetical protein KL86PLE_100291 [uncultured Pleomorphomonas sp.]|uniref:Uncharacterized protein n=1 Tax=uncultured Pleomorphomonas sp. TaxID=442121 RepID=A0A212L275_9HYPH|nr:hypothetical protein [uncultured Pleomorphomonas sp.]SCM71628.1 hypothetical protein KL86PLE_100291 [uncultured Pleomorphomonas sp.]